MREGIDVVVWVDGVFFVGNGSTNIGDCLWGVPDQIKWCFSCPCN
jgi:hypothetical protein